VKESPFTTITSANLSFSSVPTLAPIASPVHPVVTCPPRFMRIKTVKVELLEARSMKGNRIIVRRIK
jgi:hypothetical protein